MRVENPQDFPPKQCIKLYILEQFKVYRKSFIQNMHIQSREVIVSCPQLSCQSTCLRTRGRRFESYRADHPDSNESGLLHAIETIFDCVQWLWGCSSVQSIAVIQQRPQVQLLPALPLPTLNCSLSGLLHTIKYKYFQKQIELKVLSWCFSGGGTPVLIPNTEVKPSIAEGTAQVGDQVGANLKHLIK